MHWIIKWEFILKSSVQFSSVAQSCPTLCDPMNRSAPGLPVPHKLPEFTQTHVHWAGDAIQPSHPLSSPSPPAPNPSQYRGLFQWVNSLHQVAKVLEFHCQISLIISHRQSRSQIVNSSRALSCFTWHSDPRWTHEGSKPHLWKQPWYRREQLCSSAISTYTEIFTPLASLVAEW